jgi:hypothetical protein
MAETFTLVFDPKPHRDRYPHGYWYAHSSVFDRGADGPDPLTAISKLLAEIEKAEEE